MMLHNKVAVVYGAAGSIGEAVARAFAREGAHVFLTGHARGPVDSVAHDISASDGFAEAAEVDALDEQAIETHLKSVVAKEGRIDISFNAVAIPDSQGRSAVSGRPPLGTILLRSTPTRNLLPAARRAARYMIRTTPGVIMTVGALHSRIGSHWSGATVPPNR